MSWCDPSVAKVRQEDTRKNPLFLAHCQVIVKIRRPLASTASASFPLSSSLSRIEVRTRKSGGHQGWLWSSTGIEGYEVEHQNGDKQQNGDMLDLDKRQDSAAVCSRFIEGRKANDTTRLSRRLSLGRPLEGLGTTLVPLRRLPALSGSYPVPRKTVLAALTRSRPHDHRRPRSYNPLNPHSRSTLVK